MKNRKLWILPILMLMIPLLVVAERVYADAVQVGYRVLLSNPTKRTGQSSADALTWGTPLAATRSYGNSRVTANVEWTAGGGGATCAVSCGLYGPDGTTFLGMATVPGGVSTITTLTSVGVGAGTDGALVYTTTGGCEFDLHGAPYWDLRVNAISAGTITVRPWSYGIASAGQ